MDSSERAEALQALARRLRALREGRRMTQDEFARRCGISVSFASLLERGERSPSYDTLMTVARVLEVSVADLFRDAPAAEVVEPSHGRLVDFARNAQLSRAQIDRFIAVGQAMFGLGGETVVAQGPGGRCLVEGCGRRVLARGLCASHYHRERRGRLRA